MHVCFFLAAFFFAFCFSELLALLHHIWYHNNVCDSFFGALCVDMLWFLDCFFCYFWMNCCCNLAQNIWYHNDNDFLVQLCCVFCWTVSSAISCWFFVVFLWHNFSFLAFLCFLVLFLCGMCVITVLELSSFAFFSCFHGFFFFFWTSVIHLLGATTAWASTITLWHEEEERAIGSRSFRNRPEREAGVRFHTAALAPGGRAVSPRDHPDTEDQGRRLASGLRNVSLREKEAPAHPAAPSILGRPSEFSQREPTPGVNTHMYIYDQIQCDQASVKKVSGFFYRHTHIHA